MRTRESSRKLNQIILLVALAYGALLAAVIRIAGRVRQVYESIYYWVVGAVFVIGLIQFLFFRKSFDFFDILWEGFILAVLVSTIIGLGANLFTFGIKVLGVAALAAVGAYLFGMLLGHPVFRILERLDKTWMKWVFVILAVIIAAVLGWFGILAIFPVGVF